MLLPEVRLILQRQTEEEEEADRRKEKETSWVVRQFPGCSGVLVVPSRVAAVYLIGNSRREKSGRASMHCAVDESCPGLPEESNEPSRFMFVRAVMALTPREVSSKAKPSAIFPSQRARLDIEGTISKGIRD
ncbi:hypothetical protein ALC57_14555 [Trachymyrmex cornetzi]|uniref:Uncharacterized protein n=1 Tax=Trachymyrmex cornetzi TaxID=471704 RepID=A0A151IYE2_9HYME|nr:hypothetical protein ALC57_14555 [Trachymyrmex cornetzi]